MMLVAYLLAAVIAGTTPSDSGLPAGAARAPSAPWFVLRPKDLSCHAMAATFGIADPAALERKFDLQRDGYAVKLNTGDRVMLDLGKGGYPLVLIRGEDTCLSDARKMKARGLGRGAYPAG